MQTTANNVDGGRTTIDARGLWRLDGEGVHAVDRAWPGPLTVLAPCEKILIAIVDLPFASRSRRVEAAPYAVEGLIADPLDQVHVALGAELAPRRHLCAVVRRTVMRDWLAILDAAGLDRCILLPDALAIRTPPPGAWAVAIDGDRALVRTDDGAGFALDPAMLADAWDAAGRPRLSAQGDPLPDALRAGIEDTALRLTATDGPEVVAPAVDLRQGVYAARSRPASPWSLVGGVAVAGIVAHLGLAAIDTLVLDAMADRREVETRRLLAERRPDLETTPDLAAAVDAVAPTPARDSPLSRALSRVANALAGQPLAYRRISYSGGGGPIILSVSSLDAATMSNVVTALNHAALPARSMPEPAEGAGLNAVITIQPATGVVR